MRIELQNGKRPCEEVIAQKSLEEDASEQQHNKSLWIRYSN